MIICYQIEEKQLMSLLSSIEEAPGGNYQIKKGVSVLLELCKKKYG